MTRTLILLSLLLGAVPVQETWAQAQVAARAPVEPATPRPTSLTKKKPFKAVAAGPARVAPGDSFTLRYTIYLLNDKHYLYKDACSVTVSEAGPFQIGEVHYWPKPQKTHDPFENTEKEVYHKPLTMYLTGKVPPDTAPGKVTVRAVVAYRGCNESVCFFPTKETLELDIEVGPR